MAEYLGHIITIVTIAIGGAIGFGILKATVKSNTDDVGALKVKIGEYEARIRELENSKAIVDAHMQNAPRVLEKLESFEKQLAEMRAEMRNNDEQLNRIDDVLEANRIVLSEVSKELAVLQALRKPTERRS